MPIKYQKKIPRNLGQEYQIPIWYWYFLDIPNFWFPIYITSQYHRLENNETSKSNIHKNTYCLHAWRGVSNQALKTDKTHKSLYFQKVQSQTSTTTEFVMLQCQQNLI